MIIIHSCDPFILFNIIIDLEMSEWTENVAQ